MSEIEDSLFEGETLEEALLDAEHYTGMNREEFTYEVVDEGAKGLLGFGRKLVQIKITGESISSSREMANSGAEFVREVVRLMDFEASVWAKGDQEGLSIEIEGDDVGLLIGRRGANLEALRLLAGSALAHRWQHRIPLSLDIDGYQRKRHEKLADWAKKLAQQVVSTKKPRSLSPMPPGDRRAVHLALKGFNGVYTESSGGSDERKVVIYPGKKPEEY